MEGNPDHAIGCGSHGAGATYRHTKTVALIGSELQSGLAAQDIAFEHPMGEGKKRMDILANIGEDKPIMIDATYHTTQTKRTFEQEHGARRTQKLGNYKKGIVDQGAEFVMFMVSGLGHVSEEARKFIERTRRMARASEQPKPFGFSFRVQLSRIVAMHNARSLRDFYQWRSDKRFNINLEHFGKAKKAAIQYSNYRLQFDDAAQKV